MQALASRPLEGIRVLDLTVALSGPHGSLLLGGLGDDEIERLRRMDVIGRRGRRRSARRRPSLSRRRPIVHARAAHRPEQRERHRRREQQRGAQA